MEGPSNRYVFKSRLQEYAQTVGLPTPVYDVVKEGPPHQPSFSASVIFNHKKYASLPGFTDRKAAEQSAAEIALLELSISGQIIETVSSPVHDIVPCKNMLQEFALKMNHAVPVYRFQKSKDPVGGEIHYTCSVDVGGIKYVGGIARKKRLAEINAARAALLAIKHIPGDTPRLTVIPIKRKVVEPPESKNVKKTRLRKKRKRANEGTSDVGEEYNRQPEALSSSQVELPLPESEKGNNMVSVSHLEGQNDSSVSRTAAAVEV